MVGIPVLSPEAVTNEAEVGDAYAEEDDERSAALYAGNNGGASLAIGAAGLETGSAGELGGTTGSCGAPTGSCGAPTGTLGALTGTCGGVIGRVAFLTRGRGWMGSDAGGVGKAIASMLDADSVVDGAGDAKDEDMKDALEDPVEACMYLLRTAGDTAPETSPTTPLTAVPAAPCSVLAACANSAAICVTWSWVRLAASSTAAPPLPSRGPSIGSSALIIGANSGPTTGRPPRPSKRAPRPRRSLRSALVICKPGNEMDCELRTNRLLWQSNYLCSSARDCYLPRSR